MSETVLITGGTGYIGGWAIVRLLQSGYRVRTTVRSLSKADHVRSIVAQMVEPGDRLSFAEADLASDEGWDAAVSGCAFILHIASPLSTAAGADMDVLLNQARGGTLRVLRAAVKAGVKRVVVTSGAAAANPGDPAVIGTEDIWTDTDRLGTSGYYLSKVMAERAAWDFMAEQDGATELVTILPGAVFGPVLSLDNLGSVQFIQRMLQGDMPAIPNVQMQLVDVRDLADAHIAAMVTPEAAGQRFLVLHEVVPLPQIGAILRDELGARAAKVPTRTLPDGLVRLLARFIRRFKLLAPILGPRPTYTADKAKRILGYAPRPARDTIIDTADSLFTKGAI